MYIENAKLGYQGLLDKVVAAFDDAGLPIDRDGTCWDYARVLRLPNTINKKENKDGSHKLKKAYLRYNGLEVQVLDIPMVKLEKKSLSLADGSWPLPDIEEITENCNFFKWLDASDGVKVTNETNAATLPTEPIAPQKMNQK